MSREPVVSGTVSSVGYVVAERILEVEFVHGGVYQYAGVVEDQYAALMAAESKGQHLNRFIKGRYPFRKVSP